MILAELARENGVFEWMADLAAVGAKQSAWRLFALTYLVGTVVTALLSNDATAVVLTPAILAIVRKARSSRNPICSPARSLQMRKLHSSNLQSGKPCGF